MSSDLARILVPTDFRAPADGAVAFAKTLAHTFGASLHVIHVLDDPTIDDTASAERRLDAQLTADERQQLRATTVVLRGSAAATIVSYAERHGVDLIVMGTDGRSRHGSPGGLLEQVVRLGSCPVLTYTARLERAVTISGQAASTFV
jgi:nucleotide-binding universal stress UspA family protein